MRYNNHWLWNISLQDTLLKILQENYNRVIIVVDFNDRCTTWYLVVARTKVYHRPLIQYTRSSNYWLTREVTETGILDKIFDHAIPYCGLTDKLPKIKSYKQEVWKYDEGSYERLREHLSQLVLTTSVIQHNNIDKTTDTT
jgi:hypothetical protein